MANSLVDEDARPARPQYHFHLSGRRCLSAQLHNGLPRRLLCKVLRCAGGGVVVQRDAPATAARAACRRTLAAVRLRVVRKHRNAEAAERLRIRGPGAVAGNHQDVLDLVAEARAHLRNAAVVGARGTVGPLHQLQLRRDMRIRSDERVEVVHGSRHEALHLNGRRAACNQRRCFGSVQQPVFLKRIRIAVAGALTADDTHAAPAAVARAGGLDDAFIDADGR